MNGCSRGSSLFLLRIILIFSAINRRSMLSPIIKSNLQQILPFGLIFLASSFLYVIVEKSLLADLQIYPASKTPYNFNTVIYTATTASLIFGLLFGTLEIQFIRPRFENQSLISRLIFKTLIYTSLMVGFLVLATATEQTFKLNLHFLDPQVWTNVGSFFFHLAFWGIITYVAATVLIALFYSEVSNNIGQSVLLNLFAGRYHRPKEEERIFMFLDMKSSTAIAEKLGHLRYFEMLKSYYADLSSAVVRHSGEIYQYVGDEMIVSWKLKEGLYQNNCIQCFLDMKATLQQESAKYQNGFGLVPGFKAGFHYGKVTTGEIGVVKKDIMFSGDVLNTTARLQGLCNTFEVDNLLSGDLMQILQTNVSFRFKSLGKSELRGRDEKVELYTIITN